MYLYIYLYIYQYIYPSIYPSIYLAIYLSIYLSIYLGEYVPDRLPGVRDRLQPREGIQHPGPNFQERSVKQFRYNVVALIQLEVTRALICV